jgi:hypothetical protein
VFGADGRAAKSLRAHVGLAIGVLALAAAVCGSVLLLGWKFGELTSRL